MNIRHLDQPLSHHFRTYKQALVLLGARQVGKTTLLKRLFPHAHYLLLDNEQTRRIFESYDLSTYRQLLGRHQEIILDELHLLSNSGRALKIIYDQLPGLKLIVTGSSSLQIKNKTGESMAGRKIDYHLYPLTFSEYLAQTEIETSLNTNLLTRLVEGDSSTTVRPYSPAKLIKGRLLYGLYPELVNLGNNRPYLENLADTAVFQDLLELKLIENKQKGAALLKLLAYQIGSLINYSELAGKLSLDQRTVKRYLDIFENSFIIFRLYPYSKRKRSELVKNPKIYFWDTGLRNALIHDFEDLVTRPDYGPLFENFYISEVAKLNSYLGNPYSLHYWRTKSGSEVDLILANNKSLLGCEIKLHKGNISSAFTSRYPHAHTRLITLDNFI